jgi:hypothetical protein
VSRRRGRTTTRVVPTDGGVSPNAYNPNITVEIRVFAPPHCPSNEVVDVLNDAYREAVTDAFNDYQGA